MGGVFNPINFAVYHYAGNNPIVYTDPDGREIGDINAPKTMQSGAGTLGFSNYQVKTSGCVVTAWGNIVNTINGNQDVTPGSFGVTYAYNGSGLQGSPKANVPFVANGTGKLDVAGFVSSKTNGWTVLQSTENLAATLSALDSIGATTYVAGSGDLVDGNGNHTVNIVGVAGANGTLPYRGTSNNDAATNRKFTLGDSDAATNTSTISKLTFAVPTDQLAAFNQALQNVLKGE